MTENRRGEIALLLIEALPFTDCLFDGSTVQKIDEFKEVLADAAKKMGVSIAELGSIFRPGFDKMLNLMFPENTQEVFFRRGPEAKKIAIQFWETSKNIRLISSPEKFLNNIKDTGAAEFAGIFDEEIRKWAESFFVRA